MKLFVKSISVLMVLPMCLGILFYGCKKDTPNTDETTSDTTVAEVATTQEQLVTEQFGEDGSPKDYVMQVRTSRYSYLFCDEISSDRVEQATYERNINIEDMFNIRFSINESVDAAGFENALLAGDSTYSLTIPDYWWGLERKGLFINLCNCDEIDFEDSYWYSGWNSETTVYNKAFSIVGDGTLELLQNLEVVFFNKDMLNDIGGDVYQLYNDGNWTIEEMQKLIVQAGQNLDDNDATNDIYGALYDMHSLGAQAFSCGLKITNHTNDGAVEFCMKDENNINMVDILSAFLHNNKGVLYSDKTNRAGDNPNVTYFSNGRSLFYAAALERAAILQDSNTDFKIGIVPMPKLDANQSNYVSTSYGLSFFAIPKAAADEHMSATILNAMNYLSNDTIVETFYDIVMKGQFSDTENDANMIDNARENIYFDFAFSNESALGAPQVVFRTAIRDNSAISSSIDSISINSERMLEELLMTYSDLQ